MYDICGAQSTEASILSRKKDSLETPEGAIYLHRDNFAYSPQKERFSEYIIFSSPYNEVNAPTEFVFPKDAIASIPSEMRQKIKVFSVERSTNIIGGISYTNEPRNLNQVLRLLDNPPTDLDKPFTRKIKLMSAPESPEGKAFLKAIEDHSVMYNIQPGTLVILNENNVFHRAHHNTTESISDALHTRLFMHHAGAPQ